MADQNAGWNFPIQWARNFGEEIRFRTEVITSRDGTEQRIAQRVNPRLTYEFESFLNFQDFRQAVRLMMENQGRRIAVPHPRRQTRTTGTVTPDTSKNRAVCISIDDSGSMLTGGHLGPMKESMNGVIDELIAAKADGRLIRLDLMVTRWGDTATSQVYPDADEADLNAARGFIQGFSASSGGTNFDSAAQEAVTFFNSTLANTFGRRIWFFITDGQPTGNSHLTAETTAADLLNRNTGLFRTSLGTAVDCYGINIQEPVVTFTRRLDNTPEDDVPVVSSLDPDALLNAVLAGAFGQPVSVEQVFSWMRTGSPVFLDDGDKRELVNVIRTSPGAFFTDAPLRNSFGPGTKVLGGEYGFFSQESELRAATSRVGLSKVSFDADPVAAFHEAFSPTPPATLNGRELLVMGHQWAGDLRVSFEQPFEDLDLQRGRTDRLFPVGYTSRVTRLRFVIRNDDHYNRIVGLFYRCKGRQRSFYAPSYIDEIRPLGPILALTSAFAVRGRELHDQIAENSMYRWLQFTTRTQQFLRGVTDVIVDPNGNTRITVDEQFGQLIPLADIKSIQWVVRHRFETDSLSLEWLTDGVAEVNMTVRTLEDI